MYAVSFFCNAMMRFPQVQTEYERLKVKTSLKRKAFQGGLRFCKSCHPHLLNER